MSDERLDQEVKIGLADGLVLAVAAPALALNFVPLIIALAVGHIGLGLWLSQERWKWLASSAGTWAVAGIALYALWAFNWNPPAGIGDEPNWLVLGSQAVLLPAIMVALFGAPGERSLLADYVKKFGDLRP